MSIRKMLIGIILPAVLCLFAPIAFVSVEAADNTYTVENQYTVTIPAEVTVDPSAGTVSFAISGTLENGYELNITITSQNNYKLVNQDSSDYKLAYTMKKSNNEAISTPVYFANPSGSQAKIDCSITISVTDSPAVSGTYIDYLTFNMASASLSV